MDKAFERYIENLYEHAEINAAEYGHDIDDMQDDIREIEKIITEYSEKIDFKRLHGISNDDNPAFEHSISDSLLYFKTYVNDELTKDILNSFLNLNTNAIDYRSVIAFKAISNQLNDFNSLKEYFNTENSSDAYFQNFIDYIKDKNKEYFKEQFPNSSGTIQKHFFSIMDNIIENQIDFTPRGNNSEFEHRRDLERTIVFKKPQMPFKQAKEVFEMYNENKNIIKPYSKLNKDDPNYFNLLECGDFEKMTDFFHFAIEQANIKSYNKKILGSYKKMANDETFEKLNELYQKGVKADTVKDFISTVALYDSVDVLNNQLKNLANTDKFSLTNLEMTIQDNNLNASILHKDDSCAIVKINDFESCSMLGTNRWCISTSKNYYERYLNNSKHQGKSSHFFVFDFSCDESDASSKIGLTLDEKGTIHAAFNRYNIDQKNKLEKGDLFSQDFVQTIKKVAHENLDEKAMKIKLIEQAFEQSKEHSTKQLKDIDSASLNHFVKNASSNDFKEEIKKTKQQYSREIQNRLSNRN